MKYLILFLCGLISFSTNAQNAKTSFSAKKINFLEVNEVKVVKHSGSQITFENGGDECRGLGDGDSDDDVDERAKGLMSINAQGMKDNTGLGLNVKQNGDELDIHQISSNNDYCYLVKVPAGTSVFYEHSSHHGEDIRFEGLDGEVEVTSTFNDIFFKDITGVLSLNSIHGSIEGEFSTVGQANPISLHSVHDVVDVTVPANTKANFRLLTSHGEIFTDLDLEVEKQDGLKKYSSNDVSGKFNGGGVDFQIKATYDNIYLRKGK